MTDGEVEKLLLQIRRLTVDLQFHVDMRRIDVRRYDEMLSAIELECKLKEFEHMRRYCAHKDYDAAIRVAADIRGNDAWVFLCHSASPGSLEQFDPNEPLRTRATAVVRSAQMLDWLGFVLTLVRGSEDFMTSFGGEPESIRRHVRVVEDLVAQAISEIACTRDASETLRQWSNGEGWEPASWRKSKAVSRLVGDGEKTFEEMVNDRIMVGEEA